MSVSIVRLGVVASAGWLDSVYLPLQSSIASRLVQAGDRLRFTVGYDQEARRGAVMVTKVDHASGSVWIDATPRSAVTAACETDLVMAERDNAVAVHEGHRAAVIAYLLSCVERADWHAVSDAANDLRVLEATQR